MKIASPTISKRLLRNCMDARAQQKVRATVGPLKDARGRLTENDQETAEVLQAFFTSVFTEEDTSELPAFPKQLNSDQELADIEMTPEHVREELRNLNPD